MKPFEYIGARVAKQAVELLQQYGDDARIIAGGAELLPAMKDERLEPSYLIELRQVPSLRIISHYLHSNLEIGAFSTLQQVADHPVCSSRFTLLAEAAKSIASPQVRYRATIGGNVLQRPQCPYYRGGVECLKTGGEGCPAETGDTRLLSIFGGAGCHAALASDMAVALTAFDASVVTLGPDGERSLKLRSFFIAPDEDPTREYRLEPHQLVTKFVVPDVENGTRSTFRKAAIRRTGDYALASVALVLSPESDRLRTVRLVLGGVAPVPWRAEAAELYLRHNTLNDATISQAAAIAVAGANPLPGNRYKVTMLKALIEDALQHLLHSPAPSDYYRYGEDEDYYGYE